MRLVCLTFARALVVLSLTASLPALGQAQRSLDLEGAYEALRNHPQNYGTFGTICEELARLKLQGVYGLDEHDYHVGISYHSVQRTIGELDVVIFRKQDREAVAVVEVKCWKNLKKALRKAKNQLGRFREAMQAHRVHSLVSTDPSRDSFRFEQFDERPELLTMAQRGATQKGFDFDLDLTIAEVRELRGRLLRCQDHGNCPTAHDRPESGLLPDGPKTSFQKNASWMRSGR